MSDSIQRVFTGRVIQLNLEQVTLPNGITTELEIVHHPGGVAIVLENAAGKLCLLRQYRHAAGGWLWELPAGKLEPGIELLENAKREIQEETGAVADDWEWLGKAISSPGVFTEVIHFYHAGGLSITQHAHEQEEVIEIHWFSVEEIQDMINTGQVYDAKTIIGFHFYTSRSR